MKKESLPARDLFGARPHEYAIPPNATPVTCASCGAGMVWVRTAAGKAMPLSLATVEERDGQRWALSHFSDCPDAREWSKR